LASSWRSCGLLEAQAVANSVLRVAFQRSYFTWRFSFSVNGVVTTAVVERVEEKAHIKSGVETDVYYIYKDKKSIIHQGKDNIDGNTHLRAGDRVKIEHLKNHPDSSKIHHNRPWWYGLLCLVLGGTILFNPFGIMRFME